MRDATCFVGVLLAAPAMAGGVTEPCVHVAFARSSQAKPLHWSSCCTAVSIASYFVGGVLARTAKAGDVAELL
ncbi:Unannotated [Lentimonas sp. CC4]|nr:Unannotated [Lentimonas sp. CC4]